MPVLVTGIHVGTLRESLRTRHRTWTWMAGTGPGHDGQGGWSLLPLAGLRERKLSLVVARSAG